MVGWLVLGPSYFSQDAVLSVFFIGILLLFAGICDVRAKNDKRAQPTNPHLAVPVALEPRVDPTALTR